MQAIIGKLQIVSYDASFQLEVIDLCASQITTYCLAEIAASRSPCDTTLEQAHSEYILPQFIVSVSLKACNVPAPTEPVKPQTQEYCSS